MAKLGKVVELAELYPEADFVTCYIMEAHPADGWRLEGNSTMQEGVAVSKNFATHRALEERMEAARHLLTHAAFERVAGGGAAMPLVVDSMTDDANLAFGALFERLYVIEEGGTIAVQGGRGPADYYVGVVASWLEAQFGPRGFDAEGL
jgi:hypothetical protein